MYKGAVFFDYDGTLTDENNHIYSPTAKTLYVLEKLRANGYATFLTTGRMKPLTTMLSGKFTGLITSNGAYTEVEGKCINSITIPEKLLKNAVEYMNRENIHYAFETSTCAYTNGLKNQHFIEVLDHFKLAKSLFKPLTTETVNKAYKIIITYDSEDKLINMQNTFSDVFDIKPHRFCLSADVNHKSVSKGVGVDAVLDYLNIPKENSYAVGDGANDLTMIKNVCHGIIMGEHSKELEPYAEFVTKSVKDDGIFFALSEHYKLI